MKQSSNNSLLADNSLSPYAREIASSHTPQNSGLSNTIASPEAENETPYIEEYKVSVAVTKQESWKDDWFSNYE